MKKIVLLAFVLVLFSTAVVVRFIRPVIAEGAIYIRADGSIEGTTDISTVDNVTYTFTDNIFNQSIVVERDNIVVDGAGYTLQGNGSGTGIDLTGRSNVTINNVEIKIFYYGIELDASSNNSITGNNITANNYLAIELDASSNNSITGNNIANNWYGIYLSGSSNYNAISGNNITANNGNGIGIDHSSNNSITGNNIANNGFGIGINHSSNSTISGNNITANNDDGIRVYSSSSYTAISGNNIANNDYGIVFEFSSNNIISGNSITANNNFGIEIYSSSNYTVISGNNITANNDDGIYLYSSSNNSVSGNNITANNGDGIYLSGCSNSAVSDNNIANNGDGIGLSGCSNSTISGNNITANNGDGIWLLYSSNNTIYHNNFVDNSIQVHSDTSTNVWDDGYPSGGNYWSDYTDVDLFSGPYQNETGCDGIGDIPYVIDGNNRDNYPLMEPYPDTTPPIITILSPENKTYATPSIPLTFTVNECTRWIAYSLDGKSNITITGNTTLSGLSEGTHTITVYANDTAGNMGTSSTVYFAVDTPPSIMILSPENKTYPVNDVPLTFTVDEPTDWIGYSLDGQTNVTIAGNTTLSGLSEGIHSIIIYANDTAGNMGYSDTVHFTIDTASPNIGILTPENKTYATSSAPLNFAVDEATSWMGYSLDGQENVTITGNTTLTGLLDGAHYVVVYANDTAGNMGASTTVYFTVDTNPPNITDVSQTPPENNVLPQDEVEVNATVTDYVSGVKQATLNYTNGNGTWITIDMTNLEGNIWNATIPAFPYCTNVTYIIIAEDNANNTITTEEMEYEYKYHVIPELPTWTSILLILIALTVAIAVYKRRLVKAPIQ